MIHVPADPSYHRIFDALAWASGLGAGWLAARWRLKEVRAKFPRERGYLIALGVGAILGAYLAGSLTDLLSGGGSLSHSVAGALAGGILAVEAYKLARGIKGSTGTIFVVPFAVGIIVGRWGCLFAGLPDGTYGTMTALPWAVDLGDGVPRHPVEIYESLAMLLFLLVYLTALARRVPWAMGAGFYVMVMWYALQRFVWEFLKPYPRVLGPFNLFQLICLGLFAYGLLFLVRARSDSAQSGALHLLRPDDEPVRDVLRARAGEDPGRG